MAASASSISMSYDFLPIQLDHGFLHLDANFIELPVLSSSFHIILLLTVYFIQPTHVDSTFWILNNLSFN